MSYASILSVLGWAMGLFAGAMVPPTLVALGSDPKHLGGAMDAEGAQKA